MAPANAHRSEGRPPAANVGRPAGPAPKLHSFHSDNRQSGGTGRGRGVRAHRQWSCLGAFDAGRRAVCDIRRPTGREREPKIGHLLAPGQRSASDRRRRCAISLALESVASACFRG